MVRAQPFDALLVFVGVGLSLLWFSVLVTQLVNIHLRFPAGLEPATILDWELVTRFAELRAVPPEIPGLVVLALAIHFFAAYAAWRR